MEAIYQSPLISFVHNTQPMEHPEGDYTAFNKKLKRIEYLVNKYQPNMPIVVRYSASVPINFVTNQKNN